MGQYALNVVRIAVAGEMLVAAAASSLARNCAMLMAVDSWLGDRTGLLQGLSCLFA